MYVGGWFKTSREFAPDAPFLTSGGKILRNVGMRDTSGRECVPGNIPMNMTGLCDWVRAFCGGNPGFTVREICPTTQTDSDAEGTHPLVCFMAGSYSLRMQTYVNGKPFASPTRFPPEALLHREYQGKGVISDSLMAYDGNGWQYDDDDGSVYWPATNPDWFLGDGGSDNYAAYNDHYPRFAYTNHDGAWNVLFADGSVKTFSDAGGSVLKDLWVKCTRYGPSWRWNTYGYSAPSWCDRAIWRVYFDALYAQD